MGLQKRVHLKKDNMGCAGSRFDEMPVTGHSSGLAVLPGSVERFLRPEHTVLKLREKFWSFSGDDSSVKDINGQKWFKIHGSAFSMREKRKMEDVNGVEICGYQKKLLSMHATAYITIKDQSGSTFVVATIKRQSNFQMVASADIYFHNPPVSIDDVTTSGVPVAIMVEGDIIAKKYDFMMGNINTNPYKIAQVVRKFQAFFENNSYFINIGPNVDVAFICMCAYAIDELFNDQN